MEEINMKEELVSFANTVWAYNIILKGYDVIQDFFFIVLEYQPNEDDKNKTFEKTITTTDFDDFYAAVNGEIYTNACYAFMPSKKIENSSHKIDLQRLYAVTHFIDEDLSDYSSIIDPEDLQTYKEGLILFKNCHQFLQKLKNCNSTESFLKLAKTYSRTKLAKTISFSMFVPQFYFYHTENKLFAFEAIMELAIISYDQMQLLYFLCILYPPDMVYKYLLKHDKKKEVGQSHRGKLREFIKAEKEGKLRIYKRKYFDERIHCYVISRDVFLEDDYDKIVCFKQIFETFNGFSETINFDLCGADLSTAYDLNINFSQYKTDNNTKYPLRANDPYNIDIKKYFEEKKYSKDNCFHVTISYSKNGIELKSKSISFDYFFDFVHFLGKDLSAADLLFCDGLKNIESFEGINLDGAILQSCIYDRCNVSYEKLSIASDALRTNQLTENEEISTSSTLAQIRDDAALYDENYDSFNIHGHSQNIAYISDLHLLHKIDICCNSESDLICFLERTAKKICDSYTDVIMIAGDTCSDYNVFQKFVVALYHCKLSSTKIVFVLGNHEFWSFPDYSYEEVVGIYRAFLNQYEMFLLENDLFFLYKDSSKPDTYSLFETIPYQKLLQMSIPVLSAKLTSAYCVIFGGTGFSGKNDYFNADNGIYGPVINRKQEIDESRKINNLYEKLKPILTKKNSIVVTHMPKRDWSEKTAYDKGIVFVSGHTHHNYFHDDGEIRVYEDNQIGYHNEEIFVKEIIMDAGFDYFSDYQDGIYKITREEYKQFYRGKCIYMKCDRELNGLYMLKKNGYYCFISKNKSSNLCIMNGGSMKKIHTKDIQFIYDNMDKMIAFIETPLSKYMKCLKYISRVIRKIGGSGIIHGCIVDISFFNHVYVNPYDASVSYYSAPMMGQSIIYPSFSRLLEKECPDMYLKYQTLLQGDQTIELIINNLKPADEKPEIYLGTEIYKASRIIKKMQNLYTNILTIWNEEILTDKSGNDLMML